MLTFFMLNCLSGLNIVELLVLTLLELKMNSMTKLNF